MFQRIVQTLKHRNAQHKHYNIINKNLEQKEHTVKYTINQKCLNTKSFFETNCFDSCNRLDLEKKKLLVIKTCEQNSCFETKMSQKSCFETKYENKTFASKPKCFLKNLATKFKCLNTSLTLKPNV